MALPPTRRLKRERLGELALASVAAASCGFVLVALAWTMLDGALHLARRAPLGAVGVALADTLYLAALSTALCAPAGVAVAAWLARARPTPPLARAARAALEGVADLPAVVHGLVGYVALVAALGVGPSIVAGALVLALVNLPVVVAAAEESLRNVPPELEEASLALGASRAQTFARVLLPAAAAGVLSGVVRAAGGAFAGGAALVWTMGAVAPDAWSPTPWRGGATLAVYLWHVDAAGPGERAAASVAAATLVALALATTALAERLRARG